MVSTWALKVGTWEALEALSVYHIPIRTLWVSYHSTRTMLGKVVWGAERVLCGLEGPIQ